MTTRKPKQAADTSAKRLLEAIDVDGVDYYSASNERAVAEALQAWPLLAEVSRSLRAQAAEHPGARLSVVGAPPTVEEVDESDILSVVPAVPTQES